jgi:hypothetical protein
MKTPITLIAAAALWCSSGLTAQQTCTDLNGYVNSRNQGSTGYYQLSSGNEEYAGQTYHYNSTGKVISVRVYGNYPGLGGGVPLRIGVYHVDASGRPTSSIATVNVVWWWFHNISGHIDVTLPFGGVNVSSNFAVTVQLLNASPWGQSFNLQYTGNGEGHGNDLASLAGTSTGNNWSSAMTSFGKDGDFYIVPRMSHVNDPYFTMSSACVNTGNAVNFTNGSLLTVDSMFNKITLGGYTGVNSLYTWNFGDGTPVSVIKNPMHTFASAGSYVVTLTTRIEGWSTTCSKTYTAKVSVGLTAGVASFSNVSCNGGSNGVIVLSAQGGAPTYSYSLSGYAWQSSSTFSGLTAGPYQVFIRDAEGCVKTASLSISQPAGIAFNSAVSSNASCGNSDGNIVITTSGGAGSIEYKLNGGSYQTAGTFTNLPAGSYTITARDANTCTSATVVAVQDQGGPSITNINATQVPCNGTNLGSISVTTQGGTGNILYSINGGQSYQAGSTFPNLPAGNYAVMVKDAAGCTDVSAIAISQPQPIVVHASGLPALCNGGSSGQISVLNSSGGIGNHNYSINGINYQSGSLFTGLPAGTYTVFARDIASCVSTTTVLITQPTAVAVIVNGTSLTCNGGANGMITVSGLGGTPSYLFSLNGTSYQQAGVFTDLGAGTYTIMVKDANNCTSSGLMTITQPAAITTTVSTTNATCGNTNGGILVLGSGGTGGFQYSLNGTNFYSSGSFSPLASGTYYVMVKDGASCTKIVSATIADSNGPNIVNHSFTNISCNGGNNGSISITGVTGGSGSLMYSINGVTWQSSPVFGNLPAGNYFVTVKDANGCSGTVPVTLTQPNPFLINPVTSNPLCNNAATGSATITAGGGAGFLAYGISASPSIPPLTYQSLNIFNNLSAGTYYVHVKDAANCMGVQSIQISEPAPINISLGVLNVPCYGDNNGQIYAFASGGTGALVYSLDGFSYSTVNTWNNLAGNAIYQVYVKDANNCVRTQTVIVSQPAPISVIPIQSNVSCHGGNNGAINLAVSGGVFPYYYRWSNGSYDPGIFNLSAGNYSVKVQDYNGCNKVLNFSITQPANPLIVNAAVVHATSGTEPNGSIDITTTGGVPPYTFAWSNGSTQEDLNGVQAGAYLVTIKDANGCITSATYFVGSITSLARHILTQESVMLFPNPAGTDVTIRSDGANIESIEVLNMLGETVYTADGSGSSIRIDVSGLNSGSYLVKLTGSGNTVVKRMVIMH